MLPTLVSIDRVDADRNERRDLWRMLTADNVGHAGATAGVADYHPRSDEAGDEPPALGAAHARPEVYFVLAGSGMLHTPDNALELTVGDAFLIPGGVPHTIEGTNGTALRAFYVSLKGAAT